MVGMLRPKSQPDGCGRGYSTLYTMIEIESDAHMLTSTENKIEGSRARFFPHRALGQTEIHVIDLSDLTLALSCPFSAFHSRVAPIFTLVRPVVMSAVRIEGDKV